MNPIDPLSLPNRRLAAIAPHPDDECLGCGGLISAFAADGRDVLAVFVTDGSGSHPHSREWPAERLIAQRQAEALGSLGRLGVTARAPVFLDLRDAGMPRLASGAGRRALSRLSFALAAFAPDLMLLPWRRDPHCDHRDAWALAMVAAASLPAPPDILEYAVWLDEIGAPDDQPRPEEAVAEIFDISPYVSAKRAAVQAHLSQTTELITDDPTGFRLAPETIDRLVTPLERYWRPAR